MAGNRNSISCRKFYLTIDSANNLPDVRNLFDIRAYAKVLLCGQLANSRKLEFRTKADSHNGLNPVWNHPFEFDISESSVLHYGLSMDIKLYTERTLGFDGYIGEVHTTIKGLYDDACSKGGKGSVKSLPILRNGTEETNAVLKYRYSFGEEILLVERNSFMKKAMEIADDIFVLSASVGEIFENVLNVLDSF